jgi:hypothetical protein
MYFFALSQAPPVLDIEMASWTPLTRAPDKRPAVQFFPKQIPATRGDKITRRPGAIISLREASVEMAMQRLYWGFISPEIIFGNWRMHSATMSLAALPTDFIVRAENA